MNEQLQSVLVLLSPVFLISVGWFWYWAIGALYRRKVAALSQTTVERNTAPPGATEYPWTFEDPRRLVQVCALCFCDCLRSAGRCDQCVGRAAGGWRNVFRDRGIDCGCFLRDVGCPPPSSRRRRGRSGAGGHRGERPLDNHDCDDGDAGLGAKRDRLRRGRGICHGRGSGLRRLAVVAARPRGRGSLVVGESGARHDGGRLGRMGPRSECGRALDWHQSRARARHHRHRPGRAPSVQREGGAGFVAVAPHVRIRETHEATHWRLGSPLVRDGTPPGRRLI